MIDKFQKISLKMLQILSALVVAYVIAIIGKELIKYETFSFVFVLISMTTAFLYVIKDSGWLVTVIIISVIFILALALRLYVLSAYNS